jgi:hypothetical protein
MRKNGLFADRRPTGAIDEVMEATTIDGFCAALKNCLAVLDSKRGREAGFADAIKTAFREKSYECRRKSDAYTATGQYGTNVHIYCELSACLIFAGFRICLCRDAGELREQIAFITDFFGRCMSKPKSGVLTPGEAGELLAIVQKKYGLLSAVTCHRELEIYLINRSHLRYDSFLMTYKNTYTKMWLNKWLLFSLSPCMDILECNKYHVFLHEMGHILYNAVTGGGEAVPELLGEIAFLLGLPLYEDIICPEELFADLFSAISLRGTKYAPFNPFEKVLDDGICGLLELYFGMLARNAGRGYYETAGIMDALH